MLHSLVVSTILLVRHGQASAGKADYDVLSSLGEAQSRLLGQHLVSIRQPVHAVYVGPRKRQRDTARLMIEAARELGEAWPDPVELATLDEYPVEPLFRRNLPSLLLEEPELGAAIDPSTPHVDRARGFDRLLTLGTRRWLEGRLDTGELPTFAQFMATVDAALQDIATREGRGRQVLVISSAGTISAAVGSTMGTPWEHALRLGWQLCNASLTAVKYRDPSDRTLTGFNSVGHLAADQVTLR